jgi:hypothetical protein
MLPTTRTDRPNPWRWGTRGHLADLTGRALNIAERERPATADLTVVFVTASAPPRY